MIKEYIGSGKTVEEATSAAKAGLNAPITADLKIEIIEMPKKKILGLFGGSDAKVKVSYDDGVKEKKNKKQGKKQNAPAKQKQQPKKAAPNNEANKPAPAKKEEPKKAEPKKEAKEDFPKSVDLEYAKSYLSEIIKGLMVEDVKLDADYSDGVVNINLECDDYGIIIGRRGETLDSIQYLISLAMKKHEGTYVRVSINIGDYREKRYETLRHLAKKHSEYVLRTKRRYTFEPMNPYERRVIHTAVQEIEGVESRSIGYDQDRRVIIEPTGGAVKPSSRGQRNGGGRGRGGAKPKSTPPADYTPKADRADLPKFGKIEVNND